MADSSVLVTAIARRLRRSRLRIEVSRFADMVGRPRIQQRGCHRASPPSVGVRKGPAQLGRGRGGKFRPGQGDRTRHKRRRDTCPLGLPWEFDPRMKLNTG